MNLLLATTTLLERPEVSEGLYFVPVTFKESLSSGRISLNFSTEKLSYMLFAN